MHYRFSSQNPNSHYIDIEFSFDNTSKDTIDIHLPAWRPGRYELGNFAKNVQAWKAFDDKGNELLFSKIAKDTWRVTTANAKKIVVKYNYYAAEINAGSSYLDSKQLYVNPVNCCLYVQDKINEPCTLALDIPADYKVASSLKKISSNLYEAADFHEMADSPFIASNSLQHNMFVMDGVEFHLWFQGECKPNWTKLINDFFIFTNEQLLTLKEFTCEAYHFFFQILPVKFYHGVEHVKSTVIALGPSYKLMEDELYESLLGVSSHELFHSWNIKTIRPAEMLPYNYKQENYSRLGFVYEGVTTYYGDLMLFRGGVFSEQQFFKNFGVAIQRHLDNFGRFNLSVADSSFDTWLDGYVPGVPYRKTSIYDEGSIIAFVTDVLIRNHSNGKHSLDDVVRYLYTEFAKKNRGYNDDDYKNTVAKFATISLNDFFEKYVYTAASYDSIITMALDYIGCELSIAKSKKYYEAHYGIKVVDNGATVKVAAIYPNSIAYNSGVSMQDEIVAINGMAIKNDFADWAKYFGKRKITLQINRNGEFVSIELTPTSEEYYKTYTITKNIHASFEQKNAFQHWSKRLF
ncbi:MAG: M61 family metallopeptidase [Bacteroidetes bacterium]|nr:M61 family metallopeptidase [Bacteroidota bacterium]